MCEPPWSYADSVLVSKTVVELSTVRVNRAEENTVSSASKPCMMQYWCRARMVLLGRAGAVRVRITGENLKLCKVNRAESCAVNRA